MVGVCGVACGKNVRCRDEDVGSGGFDARRGSAVHAAVNFYYSTRRMRLDASDLLERDFLERLPRVAGEYCENKESLKIPRVRERPLRFRTRIDAKKNFRAEFFAFLENIDVVFERLEVHHHALRTRAEPGVERAFRILDHQMHLELERSCERGELLRVSPGDRRRELPIHHIHVDPLRECLRLPNALLGAGKVRTVNCRKNLHIPRALSCPSDDGAVLPRKTACSKMPR